MPETTHTSVHLPELLRGAWRDKPFVPFRDGIEICQLHAGDPQVALLRYAPGGEVPLHRHTGLESIVVLDGEQSDEHGSYPAGSVVLNPAGTEHRVWSSNGCVVLIQWEKPVAFI